MARYSVIVTRDTTESTVMLVEADSEEEAEAKAIEASHDDLPITWIQDDTPNASKDHYTNGAELID